ncbi:Uncharacterised protein [Actinomyces bovis]|uniref:Uncharacterized protein n=1 Tax=Actinomyces bovis TaxID=1658 RepID=A0ABY1VND1_9ACTO|nr:hypothetical protein [Actinomyces bovis]SPT53614.1 Uncharacterised protein [Actinomyces bovis]VEG55659.1 Uncharacterised protein [Actinomyces israelii]
MTHVKANVTTLRAVANDLAILANSVEIKYNTLTSQAASLQISTSSLVHVPGYVQSLRDESLFASAKADFIEIINSTDGRKVPASGEVSFDFNGSEATTLAQAKAQVGRAMGHLAQKLAREGYEDGDPRAAKLRDYLKRWNTDQHRDVMAVFYDHLGPDGTLTLATKVGNHVDDGDVGASSDSKLAAELLEQLRTGLHRASKSWSEGHAKVFGSKLVEQAYTGYDEGSPYNCYPVPVEALNWLFYDTKGAGDGLVLGSSEKMDELEKANPHPQPWQVYSPPHFIFSMTDEARAPWIASTSSVLMHALADHPKSAYRFFSDDQDRVTRWAHNHVYGVGHSGGDLSGVSAALDAASTDPGNMRRHPKEAAAIASKGLEALTSREDFGYGAGQYGVEGAGSLEHILETYMESMVDAYKFKNIDTGEPQTITNSAGYITENNPVFTVTALDKALGVVGRDGRALLKFREAVNRAEADGMPPGSSMAQLKASADSWGTAEGAIAKAIGNGAIDQAQRDDDYALAWIELGRKGAGELTGLVTKFAPSAVGKVAGWGAEALVEHLADEAKSTWASNADAARVDQTRMASQAANDFTLRMFFQADQLGLNGYQQAGSGLPPINWQAMYNAGVATQSPEGYRFINREEYNRLPPEERDSAGRALESLASSVQGFDHDRTVRDAFNDPFIEYFK